MSATAAMFAGVLILGVVSAGWASEPDSDDARREFARFLLGRDLVVEGRMLSMDRVTRTLVGGCGMDGMRQFATECRFVVDRVRFGTVGDTVLLVTTIARPDFPVNLLAPGTPVVAWAHRECADGWKLWGNFCLVDREGYLEFGRGNQSIVDRCSYPTLDSLLSCRQLGEHPSDPFNGASSVALLRLHGAIKRDSSTRTYECHSLGWVMGTGAKAPRFVDWPGDDDCLPNLFKGDSLVVPLSATFRGERLAFPVCPSALRVKNRFVTAFGVPLDSLSRALDSDASGLHVRPFISRK